MNGGTPVGGLGHEEVCELLGAYALDALVPDERVLVDAHLATCPRCRAEVDEHREVAAAMGTAISEPTAPLPDGLWDRIAAQMAEPAPSRGWHEVLVAAPGPSGRGEAVSGRPRALRRRPKWQTVAVGTLAAAAVIAIALLGVNLIQVDNHVNQLQVAVSARGVDGAVIGALANPAHTAASLEDRSGAVVGRIVLLDGRGYVVSTELEALPSSETYQLWAISEGRPTSLGLMGSHPSTAAFSLGSSTPQTLAITVEPSAGVTVPTSRPVASATLG